MPEELSGRSTGGSSSEEEGSLYVFDSTLEEIDRSEGIVMDAATRAGFPADDLPGIGMALRECMVNAVVHGNCYNEKKKVQLRLADSPGRLAITIRDEGEGFDLSDVPDPLAEENLLKQSGRGILLIRAFVDEFSVSRVSPHGTEVRMVKYLQPG